MSKDRPTPYNATPVNVSLSHTAEEIEAAATEMGMSADDLKRIMVFAGHLCDHADRSGLNPPELVSAVLDFVARIIRDCYTPAQYGALIADITHQLWALTGAQADEPPATTH